MAGSVRTGAPAQGGTVEITWAVMGVTCGGRGGGIVGRMFFDMALY